MFRGSLFLCLSSFLSVGLPDRQGDEKRRSLPPCALGSDATAVALDDLATGRQADVGALVAAFVASGVSCRALFFIVEQLGVDLSDRT